MKLHVPVYSALTKLLRKIGSWSFNTRLNQTQAGPGWACEHLAAADVAMPLGVQQHFASFREPPRLVLDGALARLFGDRAVAGDGGGRLELQPQLRVPQVAVPSLAQCTPVVLQVLAVAEFAPAAQRAVFDLFYFTT